VKPQPRQFSKECYTQTDVNLCSQVDTVGQGCLTPARTSLLGGYSTRHRKKAAHSKKINVKVNIKSKGGTSC
jgi:hypothetical protein